MQVGKQNAALDAIATSGARAIAARGFHPSEGLFDRIAVDDRRRPPSGRGGAAQADGGRRTAGG